MNDGFARDLLLFGPDSGHPPVPFLQARAYCRRLAQAHYENFTVASWLLPRRLVEHFQAVYAYCRWADDLADETGGGAHALGLLSWWRGQLLDCYAGRTCHPVFVALRETIRRFDIPAQPFLDLLLAFEQDQRAKRYQTYEQLLGYCRYSANPVGHLLLYLCGSHNSENAGLSDCICTALQLANFWQDVARDFAIGRVYLPAEDRARFGYTDGMLDERRFTPEFVALLRDLVERTHALFQQGSPLLHRVPADVRLDIDLFIHGGLATLRKIERFGYNVWNSRPTLRKWEKAALVGGAIWRRLRGNVPRW